MITAFDGTTAIAPPFEPLIWIIAAEKTPAYEIVNLVGLVASAILAATLLPDTYEVAIKAGSAVAGTPITEKELRLDPFDVTSTENLEEILAALADVRALA